METEATENTGKKKGKHPGIENLKPWQPGQSGNPGGRPKKDKAQEIAQLIFEENSEAITKAMLKALKKGSPNVFTALADRGYGKSPQPVNMEHSGGIQLIQSVPRPERK